MPRHCITDELREKLEPILSARVGQFRRDHRVLLDARALTKNDRNDRSWTLPLASCARIAVAMTKSSWSEASIETRSSLRYLFDEHRQLSLLSLARLEPDMMLVLIEGEGGVQLRNALGQAALEWIQEQDAGNFEDEKQRNLKLLRRARDYDRAGSG